ncbi:MAG: hypothetical protein V7744_18300 [Pseudomonadales bacterium]
MSITLYIHDGYTIANQQVQNRASYSLNVSPARTREKQHSSEAS